MGAAEWALLLLLSVLWGGTFFFVEIALADLPPLTLVAARVTLAAAVLWAVAALRGAALPRDAHFWVAVAIMGAFNNIGPFTLIFWAQETISGGLAAILNATTPLWTVIVAHVATRDERASAAKLAGVAIGLAGVAVVVGPAEPAGLGREAVAALAVVAATLLYAFTGVFGRRFSGRDPVVVSAGQLSMSTLMAVPLAIALDRPWLLGAPSLATIAATVALALLSTALAYVIFFRLLARAGATNLLLVTFLIPVTAILLGAVFLGERLEPRHFVGMALIGAGLAAIDGRLLRVHAFRRPETPGT